MSENLPMSGISAGGITTVAPALLAVSVAVSQSSTAKYTVQLGGTSPISSEIFRELAHALDQLQQGTFPLPPGCEVTYDLEAVNILRALLRVKEPEALKAWYESFRELNDARPTALETHHAGYLPRTVGKTHGSWLGFVQAMGDLSSIFEGQPAGDFLKNLETTQMTKSYKMLTLLAMLNSDKFPGEISIDELTAGFSRLARRSATLRADVGNALYDTEAFQKHLEKNPIAAWTEGEDQIYCATVTDTIVAGPIPWSRVPPSKFAWTDRHDADKGYDLDNEHPC
jgi:hypothetical protein